MITGDVEHDVAVVNSPSRDYGLEGHELVDGERSLTPYGAALVATVGRQALESGGDLSGLAFMDTENFGVPIDEAVADLVGKAVVGVNVMTPTFPPAMRLARDLQRQSPDTQLVFGGPHATLDPESILRHSPKGLVVVGDGESPFARLILGENKADIGGLVYVGEDGRIHRTNNGLPSVLHNLDSVPWLDRTLVANEPFTKGGKRTMTFLGSRGCVGNCTFCITPSQFEIMKPGGAKRMRDRDMRDVVGEVASLSDQIDVAQFIDDDMLTSNARVREFVGLWREFGLEGRLEFSALLRPDQVARYGDNGLLEELHNAGLNKLSLGIETGHDRGRVLVSGRGGKIDRKYVPAVQEAAIDHLSRVGITSKGFFMVGLPGETREEIEKTVSYMHRLHDRGLNRVAIFPVKVYPRTALWDAAIDLGFTAEELGHYDAPHVRQLIEEGFNPTDASRDGITQSAQLSAVPVAELNEICQKEMNRINN